MRPRQQIRSIVSGLCSLCLLSAGAATFEESFESDPASRGWKVVGDSSLFRWDSTKKHLEAAWDSARPNSFFSRPLATVLNKTDDFALSFELTLNEVAIGLSPGKKFTFPITVGFLNLTSAMNAGFMRGTGTQSPNLVEFSYFPDSGFGATVSPVIVSTNSQFIPSFSFPFELTTGDRFRITISYAASPQTLATTMTRNGLPFGPIKEVKLPFGFTDFRIDTLAVSSYSDAGADGSILARGVIHSLSAAWPDPPRAHLTGTMVGDRWQVGFVGRTNWVYVMERTEDFVKWQDIGIGTPGTGAGQTLLDDAPVSLRAYYRLRAERP